VEGPAVAASFSEASINSATRDDYKTKELNISAMEKTLGIAAGCRNNGSLHCARFARDDKAQEAPVSGASLKRIRRFLANDQRLFSGVPRQGLHFAVFLAVGEVHNQPDREPDNQAGPVDPT
jgi:hypothetical protein